MGNQFLKRTLAVCTVVLAIVMFFFTLDSNKIVLSLSQTDSVSDSAGRSSAVEGFRSGWVIGFFNGQTQRNLELLDSSLKKNKLIQCDPVIIPRM